MRFLLPVLLLSLGTLSVPAQSVPSGSSIAPGSGKYGWAQNVGWINHRHDLPLSPSGIIVREYFLSGHAWAQNIGWLDFGSSTPLDGIKHGNTMANDTGVNLDSAGNLSGYAWAQNAGFINFQWATSTDPHRPRINLLNGNFMGYAWAQNLGWINLSTGLITLSIDLLDTDSDGIDDSWERQQFSDLTTATSSSDYDKDGASDLAEFTSGTEPHNPQSQLCILSHSYNTITLTQQLSFTSSARRLYQVKSSTDLVNWAPTLHGWFTGFDTSTEITNVLAQHQTRQFYRVEAKRPLTP
jgi:hypothetical protein